uniref:hypothetical protein n=1 Tax=Rahnella sp. RFA10(1/100) TaxID=2511202 RepID=UPI001021F254|nr:hypothetical protein [Rahnella sp. RFA10(1/100)]
MNQYKLKNQSTEQVYHYAEEIYLSLIERLTAENRVLLNYLLFNPKKNKEMIDKCIGHANSVFRREKKNGEHEHLQSDQVDIVGIRKVLLQKHHSNLDKTLDVASILLKALT